MPQIEFYKGSNGDGWFLCRNELGYVYVVHEPNEASGGKGSAVGIVPFCAGTKPTLQRLHAVFTGNGMSRRSKEFRARAAQEVRTSRNGGTPSEKANNKKRASAFKSLAENEEWLEGEKGLSRRASRT